MRSLIKLVVAVYIVLLLSLFTFESRLEQAWSAPSCDLQVKISADPYNIKTGDKFTVTGSISGVMPNTGCGTNQRQASLVLYFLNNQNKEQRYDGKNLNPNQTFKIEYGKPVNVSYTWQIDTNTKNPAGLHTSFFNQDPSGKISLKPKVVLFADYGGRSSSYYKATESGFLEINFTGSTGGGSAQYELKGKIYFNPEKATYDQGEKIRVYLQIAPDSKQSLSSLAQKNPQLYINLLVNGQQVGGYEKATTDFASDQYFDVEISEKNKFRKNNNTITVELWEVKEGSGEKKRFLSTSAQLQAFGDSLSEPPPASGETGSGGNDPGAGAGGAGPGGGYLGGDGSGSVSNNISFSGGLTNPVKFNSVGQFISGVIAFLLALIGALSALFIIIGGVLMITAAGRQEQLTKGKKTLTWAVLGMATAFLGYTAVSIVQNSI